MAAENWEPVAIPPFRDIRGAEEDRPPPSQRKSQPARASQASATPLLSMRERTIHASHPRTD